jgi:hypothetical protein
MDGASSLARPQPTGEEIILTAQVELGCDVSATVNKNRNAGSAFSKSHLPGILGCIPIAIKEGEGDREGDQGGNSDHVLAAHSQHCAMHKNHLMWFARESKGRSRMSAEAKAV